MFFFNHFGKLSFIALPSSSKATPSKKNCHPIVLMIADLHCLRISFGVFVSLQYLSYSSSSMLYLRSPSVFDLLNTARIHLTPFMRIRIKPSAQLLQPSASAPSFPSQARASVAQSADTPRQSRAQRIRQARRSFSASLCTCGKRRGW